MTLLFHSPHCGRFSLSNKQKKVTKSLIPNLRYLKMYKYFQIFELIRVNKTYTVWLNSRYSLLISNFYGILCRLFSSLNYIHKPYNAGSHSALSVQFKIRQLFSPQMLLEPSINLFGILIQYYRQLKINNPSYYFQEILQQQSNI